MASRIKKITYKITMSELSTNSGLTIDECEFKYVSK